MAETDNTAPYSGYTGPVRFVVKANSPKPHPLSGNLEYSGVVLAMDDQGNVLDSYKTGLNRSRAALNDEVNRYQAQFNATITGTPSTITQNYGSESVTLNPGGSMTDPYQLTRVGEDGSLQIRTVDQRGIRVAPTITTGPERVPLGTPSGSVDITNLSLAGYSMPADSSPSTVYSTPADSLSQSSAFSGIRSLASPSMPYMASMRPITGPQTPVTPVTGFGEQLLQDQQTSNLPFTYIPGQYR